MAVLSIIAFACVSVIKGHMRIMGVIDHHLILALIESNYFVILKTVLNPWVT